MRSDGFKAKIRMVKIQNGYIPEPEKQEQTSGNFFDQRENPKPHYKWIGSVASVAEHFDSPGKCLGHLQSEGKEFPSDCIP